MRCIVCILGVFQFYISAVWWRVLSANCYRVGATEKTELLELGILRLRADLFSWYRAQKKENPDRPIYEVKDIYVSTLGNDETCPQKGPKAAESGTLLGFAVFLAKRYRLEIEKR